jgi:hypothetical protein
MKNFVKVMDRIGLVFKHMAEKFPGLSETKMKEGVFVGLPIRKLFTDDMFKNPSGAWR